MCPSQVLWQKKNVGLLVSISFFPNDEDEWLCVPRMGHGKPSARLHSAERSADTPSTSTHTHPQGGKGDGRGMQTSSSWGWGVTSSINVLTTAQGACLSSFPNVHIASCKD